MRIIARIGGLLVLAAIILPLGAWLWAKTTLPNINGTATLEALREDVEVMRDQHGVPHIFAPTWREAYVALGYVHAQDRLWQMEMTRRLGAGRLAEIVGEPALKNDKLMRTLGLYQAASDSYFALSLPVQAALLAYAEGVNAFIAEGPLPIEYTLAGFKPEPWQPGDSLVWVKLMAYTLGSNWRRELSAAALTQKIAPTAVATLLGWDQLPLPLQPKKENNPKKAEAPDYKALLAALPPAPLGSDTTSASASNAWAATNRRSESGTPLLANDPHLMLSSPVLWYLARIETPEGSLVGATAPGVPFHIAGMNEELGWGLTTTGADTSDTFVETIGQLPELYLTPNGPEAFLTRRETIKVKGADDVVLKVRQTRHGPVIGDLVDTNLNTEKTTVSLQATYLRSDDTSAEALYWMGRARTVNELEMALRFVQAPVQNVTFAERRGNIGMLVAGTIPVRAAGNGDYPAPGTEAKYDWVGIIPKHDLPHRVNPNDGIIGNANEKMVEDSYPYLITSNWEAGYRGERLQQLITQKPLVTLGDFRAWQNDTLSLAEIELKERLIVLLDGKKLDDDSAELLAMLQKWDGHDDLDEVGPSIMAVWQEELATALFEDELGDSIKGLRPTPANTLLRALQDQTHDWCDDTRTKQVEDCAAVAIASLHATYETLDDRLSGGPDDWLWGDFNIAPLTNRFWDAIPVVHHLVDNSIAVAGGQYTLRRSGRVGMTGDSDLYAVNHAAGYRGIYDIANPAQSQFIIATGQSGHVMSRYYDDLRDIWAKGDYITLKGTLRELQNADGDYLTLKAAKPQSDDGVNDGDTDTAAE